MNIYIRMIDHRSVGKPLKYIEHKGNITMFTLPILYVALFGTAWLIVL